MDFEMVRQRTAIFYTGNGDSTIVRKQHGDSDGDGGGGRADQ